MPRVDSFIIAVESVLIMSGSHACPPSEQEQVCDIARLSARPCHACTAVYGTRENSVAERKNVIDSKCSNCHQDENLPTMKLASLMLPRLRGL